MCRVLSRLASEGCWFRLAIVMLRVVALWVLALLTALPAFAQEAATAALATSKSDRATISAEELALVRAAEQARMTAIEKVYGSVVAIYGNDRGGGGSGVLVDPDGYAVTNHHVVAAAGVEGWAGLADGKLYRWKLVGTDPGGDVAVIQLRGKEAFPVAPLADSDTVRVGDWSMAMGNPFVLAEDQRPTVTLGIVSGVKRYQPGEGMNQLVYGNCIQVDSSINPGNSGGPLFNLRGEVIGINGRGSFQERGRVNVGLGYAISSNQVRRFLPELLVTKIAQHGTLDAQFGNREGGVICETLNLDSPAARAGLQLGDRLVEFEGEAIRDANQFTSLITTFPAHWPVKFTVERLGDDSDKAERQTFHVRLTPLPYEPIVKRSASEPEKKTPEPEKDPDAEEPKNEEPMPPKREGDKPDLPQKPVQVRMRALPLANAGKSRDQELNRLIARQIIERWRSTGKGDQASQAGVRLRQEWAAGEDQPKMVTELVAGRDGRARAMHTVGDQTTVVALDGEQYWQQLPGKPAERISAAKASRNPQFSQALVMAIAMNRKSPTGFEPWQLDGADKAQGQLAYRISASDEQGEQLFLWLSVPDSDGDQPIELLKSAVGTDDDEPIPATLYRPAFEGISRVPTPTGLVRGLAEVPVDREAVEVTGNFEALDRLEDAWFQMPEKEG